MCSLFVDIPAASETECSARSLAEIAVFLGGINALDQAESLFETVERIKPTDPTGSLGRCDVAIARGDLRAGIRLAERAMRTPEIDRHTMATALVFRADAFFGLGRRQAAIDDWNEAISCAPDSPGAQIARNRIGEWNELNSQSVCTQSVIETGA